MKVVALLMFLLGTVPVFCQMDLIDERGFRVSLGEEVPDFKLELIDGTVWSTDQLRGKVVVLQFTASWCSVCRKEMPHLENEVWLPNKDKKFLLIGVDYDESPETVAKFVRQMKTTYPMAMDPGGKIFQLFAYPKSGVTRNVVIDQQGKIVFLTRLYDTKEFNEMKKIIAAILN